MAEIAEKRVAPLELFFDLVFVFALTQVTQLMSNDPSYAVARWLHIFIFAEANDGLDAADSYSYLHLPMIAGIVLLALGVKKTLAHMRRSTTRRLAAGSATATLSEL
jgi:low temperature requirement protein LtrA